MAADDTTQYIEAAAAVLELDIKPDWMPNVVRFFEVARGMADVVAASGALTASEQAPIFTPRDVA